VRATTPTFADPLVAIVPRLFIGVSPGCVRALRRLNLARGGGRRIAGT